MMKNNFISLLSPGLDSPIATYLIMNQGFSGASLSFLNGGNDSVKNKEKMLKIGKHLVNLTNQSLLMYFVDYDSVVEEFVSKCTNKWTCLICKRTMIQIAQYIAQKEKYSRIINGDILGEQASQTMDNLFVVNSLSEKIPIIRPLIGFDKLDIINLSRELGFYAFSLIQAPGCAYNPPFPETHGRLDDILEDEYNIDRKLILNNIISNFEIVQLEK